MADELVEKVRYEADITDIQGKLRTISDEQGKTADAGEKSAGRISKAFGSLGSGLKNAAVWFAGVGGAAAVIAPKLLDAGANLQAIDEKAKTVFSGGSLASVQAWAKNVAGSFGLTQSQVVAMASSMGDLFKPMGFTADQAAKMSIQLGDLSGALSAWSGGKRSAAEVSDIITKAMLGERDALKELGVSISEEDVQARLAANGQKDLTGKALEQAKAQATLQLITEKSTDAQKAWTDGSMDAIKQQNEAKASLKQLGETVTRMVYPILVKLVPVVQKVAEWLGVHLPPAMDAIGKKFAEWWPKIRQVVAAVVDWLVGSAWPVIQKVWTAISDGIAVVVGWVRRHWDEISNIVAQAVGFVRGAIDTAVTVIQTLWRTFGDNIIAAAQTAWGYISGVVKAAMEVIHGIINTVMGLIHGDWSKVWDGLKGIVSGVWDYIKTIVRTAIAGLATVISTAWNGVKLAFSLAWEGLKTIASGVVDGIVGFFRGLPGRLLDLLGSLGSAAKDLGAKIVGKIGEGLAGLGEAILRPFKSAWNAVANWWNSHVGNLSFKVPSWVPGVGGKGFDMPDLPKFHQGGITDFGFAGEGLALLRNREAVIPLDNPRDAARVAGQAGLVAGTTINGPVTIVTTQPARSFFDEALWRVA